MENDLTNNPFLKESKLPYFAPDFTKIQNKHFKPALVEAMKQQSDAVNAIVKNTQKTTFDNTILALEKSGEMLDRVNNVFKSLTAAHTNDTLKKVETEIAPLAAKHYDEIYLNDKLFAKVKDIYTNRGNLNLDAES
ncbi:MAG TPA: dipeptidyl carboxypeptidase II, partial [Lutibacter sp.]|nr:dipeptidyl carboxypeptidase II [Lutibacter sp.]